MILPRCSFVRIYTLSLAIVAASFALISAPSANAQTPAPSPNQPTAATMTGAPPYSTHDGVREDVALASGGLAVYVPILSLKGKGGQTFNLGWTHDSHGVVLQEYDVATGWNLPGTGEPQPYNYVDWLISPDTLGYFTVPHLRVSWLFLGDYCQVALNGCNFYPLFCNSNFVFRDESGTSYTFGHSNRASMPLARDCSYTPGSLGGQDWHTAPTGVSDQSCCVYLDASNPNDIVVWTKDGTAYHFPGFTPAQQYYGLNPGQSSNGPEVIQNYYDNDFLKIVDPNGNTITKSGSTITDSVGHKITVTNSQSLGGGSVTWTDSNGITQTAAATPGGTPGPAVSTHVTSCQFNNQYQAPYQSNYIQTDVTNLGNLATGMTLALPGGSTTTVTTYRVIHVDTCQHADPGVLLGHGRQRKSSGSVV
jgi:hypothetical protein